ncbi:hypothetical protein PoB_007593500 [Plakobranchus ocellatus]|uniref:Uncharacterized protein n=1 Tax=Plakobranchus ocellatus TaxID=259542 RepID=A0AAV4DZI2_9GAST|nr:hypothetical protein PoB_007593500 [Plakobranchus ocellatus]
MGDPARARSQAFCSIQQPVIVYNKMFVQVRVIALPNQTRDSQRSGEGIGGTVDSESALRSSGTLPRRFEPRHQRSGLAESLKA